MSFLPDDYKKPEQGSKYLSPSKIEGEVKIRILTSAITGWVDWDNSGEKPKPVRTKEEPATAFDPKRAPRHFWAFAVWNYSEEVVQIMEIPQSTIQNLLISFINDEDWGNPTGYDVRVKKEGKDLKTKYTLTPSNKSVISPEIAEAFGATNINVEKMFSGDDPFGESTDEILEEVAEKEEKDLGDLAAAM